MFQLRTVARTALVLVLAFSTSALAGTAPVTWHRFDETGQNTSVDDSGSNQDGIVKRIVDVGPIGGGGFQPEGGKFDGAFYFTPFGDVTKYAQFVADFDIAGEGTISFYMWHNAVGFRQAYIRSGNLDFDVELHSSSKVFSSMPGGDTFNAANTVVTAGAWHHVAVTWDGVGADAHCIYLDGVLQRCNANWTVGPVFQNREITLGQRRPLLPGTSGGLRNLQGALDDVAFYDRALTPAEIVSVRDAGAPAVASGLVAYWNLDDPEGTLLAPSNAGNDLDLYVGEDGGDRLLGPDMVAAAGPVLAGTGVTLDAVALDRRLPTSPPAYTRVEIPDSAEMDFDKTEGTVVVWVRRDSSGFGETLLGTDDATAEILLRTSDSGRTIMRVNGDTVWQTNSGVDLAQLGVWDHMAFTWDATTGQHVIYKNATVPAQARTSGAAGPWDPAPVSDTGNWNIGFDIPDRPFHGRMADFAIFPRMLSQAEVDYVRNFGVEGFVACGDGTLDEDLGEECDDGNADDGDCCTSLCRNNAGSCDDGLFCTGTDTCADGVCVGGGGDPCQGGSECQTLCDEDADACLNPAGDPCTDDGEVCTDDVCDGEGACTHPDNTDPCDDGVFCNGADTCEGGTCSIHPGDPCTSGGECANVCNEAAGNCFVDSGTACTDDGEVCTDDECDGAGACAHPANSGPCDDGAFCNGEDTCGGGTCSLHTGDPCTAGSECSDSCNELADDCFDLPGSACTADSNECTDDVCDGAGACTHPDNTAPCDDGVFCNGADTCVAGSCTGHAGDPCASGGECADACNEVSGNCFEASGVPCSTDGNVCTDDECDGAGECGHFANTDPCDDEDACTIGDVCAASVCVSGPPLDCDDDDSCTRDTCTGEGVCVQEPILLSTSCYWSVAVVSDGGLRDGYLKTESGMTIAGDVCTDRGDLGGTTTGSWAIAEPAERNALRVRAGAQVDGDVVTAGGGVRGRPGPVMVLGTGQLEIPSGSLVDNANGGIVDTTGGDLRAAQCDTEDEVLLPDANQIDLLAATQTLGRTSVGTGGTLDLQPTVPGGLNVVDVRGLTMRALSTLAFDGGGDPDTVFIVRIGGVIRTRRAVSIATTGGMQPQNILIYVRDRRCRFGPANAGNGVVYCREGRIMVDEGTTWNGALVSGKRIVLRSGVAITHQPFGGLP